MNEENLNEASTRATEKEKSLFRTKEMANLEVNRTSTNPDDFVEMLNMISQEFGGISNLGVFCDITNVEQTSAIVADVEEQFIHVDTEHDEQPYDKLTNDGSSVNPYDFNFEHLLNN